MNTILISCFAASAAVLASGCFSPSLDNKFCGAGGSCPEGYECDTNSNVCVRADEPACADPPCTVTAADFSVVVDRELDVLFVIDNSPDTAEEQDALLGAMNAFLERLSYGQDGLPNLHVGVVSTDMGVGNEGLPTCDTSGDSGVLQNAARGACEPPNGQFIIDVASGPGLRTTNYTGELEDTFACIARLGQGGCGFEQPLESMRRALDGSNPLNIGFRRPGAYLAVVFVTNEDDCSAADQGMFSPNETPELGPVAGYRCFEFGVVCQPDSPRSVGIKQNCTVREDSPYLHDVADYVDFLKTIEEDPNKIMVAAFLGNTTPVSVSLSDGIYRLDPSCDSVLGDAQPPIRMANFMSQFPERNALASICSGDFTNAMNSIGDLMTGVIHSEQCVTEDIDINRSIAGIQHACQVFSVLAGNEIQIPECPAVPPSNDMLPCWHLEANRTCPQPAESLVVVEWSTARPADATRVEMRCTLN